MTTATDIDQIREAVRVLDARVFELIEDLPSDIQSGYEWHIRQVNEARAALHDFMAEGLAR